MFLTAERGIFELMRGNDARKYLTAIEQFAAPTYLLSEQVFEDGTPTESATPLAFAPCVLYYSLRAYKQSFFTFRNVFSILNSFACLFYPVF